MDWKSATVKDDGTASLPERWLHLHYYEALNILFRMENALRVFVYVVLKNEFKEKWVEAALQTIDEDQSTIQATAAKRLAQTRGFGYLGYEITSPLMYLNSGELTRIMVSDSYWALFKPFFRGKKEIIKTKLDEIGTVRNALAHFRPIKIDDIELIKQNMRHVFVGIEQCFSEMMQADRAVPTNTSQQWYKTLTELGADRCELRLLQDNSGKWIRVQIKYLCASSLWYATDASRVFYVTKLITSAIVTNFPNLARYCTFVTEIALHPNVTKDNDPQFSKQISLVFSKSVILNSYNEIVEQIKQLFIKIETETDLVQEDNLARGDLIEPVRVRAAFRKAENYEWWEVDDSLKCEFGENDPPEYWGEIGLYEDDFIASASQYPWMPSDISKQEITF